VYPTEWLGFGQAKQAPEPYPPVRRRLTFDQNEHAELTDAVVCLVGSHANGVTVVVTVPASVTVPVGKISATFIVSTKHVKRSTTVTISRVRSSFAVASGDVRRRLIMRSVRMFLLIALVVAGLSLVPSASAAAAPSAGGWLSLTSTVSGCTWTVNVTWAGFKGAKTLETYLTQTYTGAPLVPAFVPVKSQSGTAIVTLAPLAPSTTLNNFYAWAQLLDAHGDAIPGSLDFASISPAYCTGS
jgi:hypothetical protein